MERHQFQAVEERPQARRLRATPAQDVGHVLQEVAMPVRTMVGKHAQPIPGLGHVRRPTLWPGHQRSRIAHPWRDVGTLPLIHPGRSSIGRLRYYGKSTLPIP
jgi:hypothetical protein